MNAPRGAHLLSRVAILLCMALIAYPPTGACGAPQASPQDIASTFNLDFMVPKAPAFILLDADPSNLHRPGTVGQLGLALSEFVGPGSQITIPKAFSAEFAPWLLVDGQSLSRQEYADNPLKYRLRLSVATRREEAAGSPTTLAFGFRTSLIDGADLRTNEAAPAYAAFVSDLLRDAIAEEDELIRKIRRVLDSGPTQKIVDLARALIKAGDAKDKEAALAAANITDHRQRDRILNLTTPPLEDLEGIIGAERTRLQELYWNATVVEVALAALAQAHDSSGTGIGMDRVAGWLTAGLPIGGSGQLLLGAEGGFQRDTLTTKWKPRGTLGTRLYIGTNYLKFFAEFQTDMQSGRSPEVPSSGASGSRGSRGSGGHDALVRSRGRTDPA